MSLKIIDPINSERSDNIHYANDSIRETEQKILDLQDLYQEKYNIIINIKKLIFELNTSTNHLELKINKIKKEIQDIILNKSISNDFDINKRVQKISETEDEIQLNKQKVQVLDWNLQYFEDELKNINNQITDNADYKEILGYLKVLSLFRENSSNIKLEDLIICPEWAKELLESYKWWTPTDLLDKVIFLKWENNSWKHSVIKALWNELNRPIFSVKYHEYFSENGLYSIFMNLILYLRAQIKAKNENIEIYNNLLAKIENIEEYKTTISIRDSDGILYNIDCATKAWKKEAKKIMKTIASKLKDMIDDIEDSCILYIDDLDEIIMSSKYDKWDLLAPIKTVIDDIKNEGHDVILILVGDKLGNNNNNFKFKIDNTIEFESIGKKLDEVFKQIILKYKKQHKFNNKIKSIKFGKIAKEYQNIKFLDKLAKKLINILWKDKNIVLDQNLFEQTLNNLISQEKSLYNWVWLK